MSRHAYLILAYSQPLTLERLLMSLDDARNDIFIHIDKKAIWSRSRLKVQHSNLLFIPSADVRWGDVSQIKAELMLIEAALQRGPYSYLHLLSDSDFPIKSQDYIHAECERLAGTEFVGYSRFAPAEQDLKMQKYHIFPSDFRNNHLLKHVARTAWIKVQKAVGYKRHAGTTFRKGPQWWSVTSQLAQYILQQREQILQTYHHSFCPDEIFVQTLLWDSPLRSNLCNVEDEFVGSRRFIPWQDGKIRPITKADIPAMTASPCWFARKFQEGQTDLTSEISRRL